MTDLKNKNGLTLYDSPIFLFYKYSKTSLKQNSKIMIILLKP